MHPNHSFPMRYKPFVFFLFLFFVASLVSCKKETNSPELDYAQQMREFVIGISQYAKAQKSNFAIIPQNGIELVTENKQPSGKLRLDYLYAIDGNGQEDLYFGYDTDNEATASADNSYLRSFLDLSKNAGNKILAIDYCWSSAFVDESYENNHTQGYISFASEDRELRTIPSYPTPLFQENNAVVSNLQDAKNFLYLINNEAYASKQDFINAVTSSNYDLLVMDLFFWDGSEFSISEIDQLRSKANGGKRMLVCYMSIGEAEAYRYYWKAEWNSSKPSWLAAENPSWPGNYKVKYWEKEWQDLIYGNDNSYLKKIMQNGFDGVYLDIIDAYEYFEE
jgi:cysteinyl-tRNA synthetase, unknown class